jgi:uncharacterized short protein YbdD (DUF466 family)
MGALTRGWAGVAWWIRGVLGADAYERYLDHHLRTGCGRPPLTEREFWRARTDRLDRDPHGRCC